MQDQFSRTELLLGKDAMEKLFVARVAVFGLGGVGGHMVEALARSGIGTLDLIDDDKICPSNLNRQIFALQSTIGNYKVDVAKARIAQINPDAKVYTYRVFYMPQTAAQFDFSQYDYVVDAIDTVTGKIALVEQAERAGTPIISCMGAGNKMDASALEVADIYETSICPLARVMRRELKKRGIKKLKVVYSREPAREPVGERAFDDDSQNCNALNGNVRNSDGPISSALKDAAPERGMAMCGATGGVTGDHADGAAMSETARKPAQRRQTPGSNAFVPAAAGLIMAGEVVRDLIGEGR
ncbi:MAG: tRNA threonylcarbamoyladenosine dehydratase [Clostridiales bacterium]|nr:tRNA threonylcarbamoyladenosine dehydratase [Clostridiales bacterium]